MSANSGSGMIFLLDIKDYKFIPISMIEVLDIVAQMSAIIQFGMGSEVE